MGLLQKAIETFDANPQLVGCYKEGREPLAPIGHILTSADVEITINHLGNLLSVRRIEKGEPKILIPVTEASGGRSGTKANTNPHPLCDGLKYLIAEENYFLPQLIQWEESRFSHPFLTAIRTYLEKKTLQDDLLTRIGTANPDDFICWRVEGLDDEESACWKNRRLHKAYTEYYLDCISSRNTALCMIDGIEAPAAIQHPKGIVSINGNAKLISANDTSGFTYRGRFTEDKQAATVSYVASQKAHNALRWLASEQGVREYVGNRIYICWNPKGKRLPQPMRGLRSSEDTPKFVPSDYREALRNSLLGIQQRERLADNEVAVLASFDAATTGRLAAVYYNEIGMSDFLRRLQDWDSKCCWYSGKFGIQAPSLQQLVNCAFGIQRGAFLETDDKIMRQHIQRLLDCKVSGGRFPPDIVQILCRRASTPQLFDTAIWRKIVFAACAAMQKYNSDMKQGGNEMSWELSHKDRSFQFGRLLAVMERAEQDYYAQTQENRQTNAIKFMSEYRQRPWLVYERINRQLHQAYLGRISPWQAKRYEQLCGEICAYLSEYPENELNKPLANIYLMGYELQRNAFFAKHENNSDNEMEE